jgi:hypothetical protein
MGVHLIEGEVHDIDMNNGRILRIAGIKVIGLNEVWKTSQVIPVTSHHRGGRVC